MQWLRRVSGNNDDVAQNSAPQRAGSEATPLGDGPPSDALHGSNAIFAPVPSPALSAPPRSIQPMDQLRASALELWSTAGEQHGVDAAERPPVSSATEPLIGHPYYVPVCVLNRGASGLVQLATDTRNGHCYAIKFIDRGGSFDVRTISRELMNQRMCYGHPNIIQLKEVFLTSHHLGIAMEYADGGDLSQYIDDQSQRGIDGLLEDDVRWLFQQLIVALDYCHRLGIANRDVKLDNMMLHGTWPSPVLKICDFGFSKHEAGQSVSKSTCGTPEYMAPEVLFERSYNGKAADVWSCGVSLYVMLTGFFPFARDSDEECTNVVRMQRMFTRIIKGKYTPLENVSPSCKDLMHGLMQPDPSKRATIDSIMAHPWFQTNLPPPLMTLNKRIMATSAHNAGIVGVTQSATELLSLVEGGRSRQQLRSASASPADYQLQGLQSNAALPGRSNSQPLDCAFGAGRALLLQPRLPSISSPRGPPEQQQQQKQQQQSWRQQERQQHSAALLQPVCSAGQHDSKGRGDHRHAPLPSLLPLHQQWQQMHSSNGNDGGGCNRQAPEPLQWHSLSHAGAMQGSDDEVEDASSGVLQVPSGRFARMSL